MPIRSVVFDMLVRYTVWQGTGTWILLRKWCHCEQAYLDPYQEKYLFIHDHCFMSLLSGLRNYNVFTPLLVTIVHASIHPADFKADVVCSGTSERDGGILC